MKAIIFGASGQDGILLSQKLVGQNVTVIGVSRSVGNWIIGDVSNTVYVKNIIKQEKPNYVFHLAANSTTRHDALFENFKTIELGSINILESVREYSPATKVFLSGSALQFKNTNTPINEETDFFCTSPYAVNRLQTTYLARYYRQKFNTKVYVGYLFNHDSSYRTDRHINMKIVNWFQTLNEKKYEKLSIGDLGAKKEFSFAGDIVSGIWALVKQNNIYEAVIGSGEGYSVGDWIEICAQKVGVDWRNHIEENPDYIPDYKTLISDPRKINDIGWQTQVGIEAVADIMFNQTDLNYL
ncbi:MAG: GDP-mannose 4,6-dehydratase [Desulfotalea sp.]